MDRKESSLGIDINYMWNFNSPKWTMDSVALSAGDLQSVAETLSQQIVELSTKLNHVVDKSKRSGEPGASPARTPLLNERIRATPAEKARRTAEYRELTRRRAVLRHDFAKRQRQLYNLTTNVQELQAKRSSKEVEILVGAPDTAVFLEEIEGVVANMAEQLSLISEEMGDKA